MTTELMTELYDKIDNEKIKLFDVHDGGDACTMRDDVFNVYGIFADTEKFETSDEEFCVMAHEYGHCKSRAIHRLYSPLEMIEQHEYRADRAAVHEFLPFERIDEAFRRGYTELWELAEFLDMPEEFVKKAVEVYRAEGLIQ